MLAGSAVRPPQAQAAGGQVPTRPFGRDGRQVSILSLGGMFDTPNNQLLLRQAVNLGVTYWDTAESYGHGQSESGFGQYLAANPGDRSRIFLVSKGYSRDPGTLSDMLEKTLERLNTKHLDLYFVHAIAGIDEMTPEIMTWGREAKRSGKIKRFGFSTHRDMDACLAAAPKLGGIDGIMFTYNFRIMHNPEMRRAVDACHKAGIGLTAMKTQGGGPVSTDSEAELKIAGRFVKKGFTDKQARLLAVWEDPRISAICSQMPSLSILMANAAAAMNKVSLSQGDRKALAQYAAVTACDYCAGCASICEGALDRPAPVAEVMRYMMYYRDYGERDLARQFYAELSSKERRALLENDYGRAESLCPQGLAIAEIVDQAQRVLGA